MRNDITTDAEATNDLAQRINRPMIESLEGRRLLSAAPLTVASLLGNTYDGAVRLHIPSAHTASNVAINLSVDPTLDSAGRLTGNVTADGQHLFTFAADLSRRAITGSLTDATGTLRAHFSRKGISLAGTFNELVEGKLLVGRFSAVDLDLAPAKKGHLGARATGSGNSLSMGFNQGPPGSTSGSQTSATGSMTSSSNGTGGLTSSTVSYTGNTSNTISLPALGLNIGSNLGNSDLASGINGAAPADNGSTDTWENTGGSSPLNGGSISGLSQGSGTNITSVIGTTPGSTTSIGMGSTTSTGIGSSTFNNPGSTSLGSTFTFLPSGI